MKTVYTRQIVLVHTPPKIPIHYDQRTKIIKSEFWHVEIALNIIRLIGFFHVYHRMFYIETRVCTANSLCVETHKEF